MVRNMDSGNGNLGDGVIDGYFWAKNADIIVLHI